MQRTYQITGFVLLILGIFLGYEATRLDYFSDMGPGAGFFPVWLCGLLGVLSIVMIAQATFGESKPMPAEFFTDRIGYIRIAIAVLGLLAIALLMATVGYAIVTFFFFVVLMPVFGRKNPIEILILSAIGGFGVYYVFTHWLSQPLPTGYSFF